MLDRKVDNATRWVICLSEASRWVLWSVSPIAGYGRYAALYGEQFSFLGQITSLLGKWFAISWPNCLKAITFWILSLFWKGKFSPPPTLRPNHSPWRLASTICLCEATHWPGEPTSFPSEGLYLLLGETHLGAKENFILELYREIFMSCCQIHFLLVELLQFYGCLAISSPFPTHQWSWGVIQRLLSPSRFNSKVENLLMKPHIYHRASQVSFG